MPELNSFELKPRMCMCSFAAETRAERHELRRRESEESEAFLPALAWSATVLGKYEQNQVGGEARIVIGFIPCDPYIRRTF